MTNSPEKRVHRVRTTAVPDDVRAFLREVAASGENNPIGLFFRAPDAMTPLLLVLGLALAVGPVSWYLLRDPRTASAQPDWLLVALVCVGLALLASSLLTGWREWSKSFPGAFVFVGPRGWWTVTPHYVAERDLDGLQGVQGSHSVSNGDYQHTSLVLGYGSETDPVRVKHQHEGDQIGSYLAALVFLSSRIAEPARSVCQESPWARGSFARQIMGGARQLQRDVRGERPVPHLGAADTGADALRWFSPVIGLGMGLVVCLLVLPMIWTERKDASLYADVLTAEWGDPMPAERYLQELPGGPHATEVTDARDHQRMVRDCLDTMARDEVLFGAVLAADEGDAEPAERYLRLLPGGPHAEDVRDELAYQRFAAASRDAQRLGRPGKLRAYLADPENRAWRDSAERVMDGIYDQAIVRVAGPHREHSDPVLLDGLVAVLEALKRAGSPGVPVAFRATYQPEPTSDEDKRAERRHQDNHAQRDAVIEAMRDESGSAVLSLGDVFDADQMGRREEVILKRLQDAFTQVLHTEVLSLRPVAEGEQPLIEIAYDTHPSGSLYLYTHTEHERFRDAPPVSTTETRGLLRGFEMAWAITISPPNGVAVVKRHYESAPLDQLNMDGSSSDPDWAPYGVMLYSAFHDFAAELVRGFGFERPEVPNTFSFADATGRQTSRGDAVSLPLWSETAMPFQFPGDTSTTYDSANGFSLPGSVLFPKPSFQLPLTVEDL